MVAYWKKQNINRLWRLDGRALFASYLMGWAIMYIRLWSIVLIPLALSQPAKAEADAEVSDRFVHRTITECINWIDGGDLDYFDNELIVSDETKQTRKLVEKFPEVNTGEANFHSRLNTFFVMTKAHPDPFFATKECNFVENFAAVLMNLPEFDFPAGKAILTRWGEAHAPEENFVEWPEGAAARGFVDRENIIFLGYAVDARAY